VPSAHCRNAGLTPAAMGCVHSTTKRHPARLGRALRPCWWRHLALANALGHSFLPTAFASFFIRWSVPPRSCRALPQARAWMPQRQGRIKPAGRSTLRGAPGWRSPGAGRPAGDGSRASGVRAISATARPPAPTRVFNWPACPNLHRRHGVRLWWIASKRPGSKHGGTVSNVRLPGRLGPGQWVNVRDLLSHARRLSGLLRANSSTILG